MTGEAGGCEELPILPTIGNPDSPPYQREAVALGPFDDEPHTLRRVLVKRADGTDARPDEIASNGAAWLAGALGAAGVDLGEFDRYVAALLAYDGWSIVHVVAGWVARAHNVSGPTD